VRAVVFLASSDSAVWKGEWGCEFVVVLLTNADGQVGFLPFRLPLVVTRWLVGRESPAVAAKVVYVSQRLVATRRTLKFDYGILLNLAGDDRLFSALGTVVQRRV